MNGCLWLKQLLLSILRCGKKSMNVKADSLYPTTICDLYRWGKLFINFHCAVNAQACRDILLKIYIYFTFLPCGDPKWLIIWFPPPSLYCPRLLWCSMRGWVLIRGRGGQLILKSCLGRLFLGGWGLRDPEPAGASSPRGSSINLTATRQAFKEQWRRRAKSEAQTRPPLS